MALGLWTIRVPVAVPRIVGAHHAVAAAEEREAAGHAELEPLESGEQAIRMPELLCRALRVEDLTGPRPLVPHVHAEALDEAVSGMAVAVDQAGHHHLVLSAEGPPGPVLLLELSGKADSQNPVGGDGHGAVFDDPAFGVHGDDGPMDDQQVHRGGRLAG